MCNSCNPILAQSLGIYQPHSLYGKFYTIKQLNQKYGFYDKTEEGTLGEIIKAADDSYIICNGEDGFIKLRPLWFFAEPGCPDYQVYIHNSRPACTKTT